MLYKFHGLRISSSGVKAFYRWMQCLISMRVLLFVYRGVCSMLRCSAQKQCFTNQRRPSDAWMSSSAGEKRRRMDLYEGEQRHGHVRMRALAVLPDHDIIAVARARLPTRQRPRRRARSAARRFQHVSTCATPPLASSARTSARIEGLPDIARHVIGWRLISCRP